MEQPMMKCRFSTPRILNITQYVLQTALLCVLSLSSARAQTNCLTPPSGLVSWWPGDGNANDIISGNNGTLTNGAAFGAGEVGQTFDLGSNHAAVVVGNPANLHLQDFTIETWIKRSSATIASTDPTALGSALIFGYGSQGYDFAMHFDGQLAISKVGVSEATGGAFVTDTNWHHVAVTKLGTTVVFYVDGVGHSTSYAATFQFIFPAAVGARPDTLNGANNDSFFGAIDELSIYNRALTAGEIQAIFAAGSAGKCPPNLPPIALCQDVTVSAGADCQANV